MKKTCRGCNNELDSCTCNVLTTDRPESLEAKVLRDEIKNLRLIDASHRIENGELRERIKELEELMPTKEEAEAYCRMDNCPACRDSEEYCRECSAAYNNCIAKLLKIAGKK